MVGQTRRRKYSSVYASRGRDWQGFGGRNQDYNYDARPWIAIQTAGKSPWCRCFVCSAHKHWGDKVSFSDLLAAYLTKILQLDTHNHEDDGPNDRSCASAFQHKHPHFGHSARLVATTYCGREDDGTVDIVLPDAVCDLESSNGAAVDNSSIKLCTAGNLGRSGDSVHDGM